MDANVQYTEEQKKYFRDRGIPVPGEPAQVKPKSPEQSKMNSLSNMLRSGRIQTRTEELQK